MGAEMRRGTRLADPGLPFRPVLALILAGLGLVVWLVGGLALGLVSLMQLALALALSPPLAVVLPPLALACRARTGWGWLWPRPPWWLLRKWAWLCRSWFRWPWLCWAWLFADAGREPAN